MVDPTGLEGEEVDFVMSGGDAGFIGTGGDSSFGGGDSGSSGGIGGSGSTSTQATGSSNSSGTAGAPEGIDTITVTAERVGGQQAGGFQTSEWGVDRGSGVEQLTVFWHSTQQVERQAVEYASLSVNSDGTIPGQAIAGEGPLPIGRGVWIARALYGQLQRRVGAEALKQFSNAMKKGLVGPTGQAGIKQLKAAVGGYTHELKIMGSADRLLGKVNEYGVLIFDKLIKGGLH